MISNFVDKYGYFVDNFLIKFWYNLFEGRRIAPEF